MVIYGLPTAWSRSSGSHEFDPMILAGEEFGDEHDLFDSQGRVTHEGGKQVDPYKRQLSNALIVRAKDPTPGDCPVT